MERTYPQSIERIRRREYPHMEKTTYLDHAGITPYASSLITRSSTLLLSGLYGNPHSTSPSSSLSTTQTSSVRLQTLEFFNASPEHFDLVFVANATAAIKVVVELCRDAGAVAKTGFWYGYHADAHTSLVGPRELAAASRCFHTDAEVGAWLDGRKRDERDDDHQPEGSVGLFAYPAQSNMTGRRLPLTWPCQIRSATPSPGRRTYTLLDAAAYAMTAGLDLSDPAAAPDFVALSLYKVFGYPDLGALLVRKSPDVDVLVRGRRYFGGGTVDMITVMQDPWVSRKETSVHSQLEDGTLPIHSILALGVALRVHEELYGDMRRVSGHTAQLAKRLYEGMVALRHVNERSLCVIYKDLGSEYGNAKTQGPTVAFNLQDGRGAWIGKGDVERLAVVRGIHLRTGGLCNPGGIATHCEFTDAEIRHNFTEGVSCGNEIDIINKKPTGVVRVSLGAMSSAKDVDTFLGFLTDLFLETHDRPAWRLASARILGEKTGRSKRR